MKKIFTKIILIVMLVSGCLAVSDLPARSAALNVDSPKLANIFFRWDITEAEAKTLAQWDVLLIDMEVQHYSPNSLRLLKKYNPKIKLLAYLASQEVRGDSSNLPGTLRKKFIDGIPNEWWLRDKDGNKVYWWPGNPILNVTDNCPTVDGKKYYDYIPWFVKNEILSTGLWDGVFYDNVWMGIDFLESFNIDLNRDGKAETKVEQTAAWRAGMSTLLSNSRQLFGSDVTIVGNGGEGYYKYINGSLYEHFPYQGWAYTMNRYRTIVKDGYSPTIGILNSNVNNTQKRSDYQKMRYGLASALLSDGFYSFDNGDQTHTEMWWYDEYDVYLGKPIGEPLNILTNSQKLTDGVWRRDFEKGVVLVNSTKKEYTIDLRAEYSKLKGKQDTVINDGSFVNQVTLKGEDGLILLKNTSEINNATYSNGSFARVFDLYGQSVQSGFFAYLNQFLGGVMVSQTDIDNDGDRNIIVANSNQIKIYNSNYNLQASFYPYGETFNQGINFVVADLDKDGKKEIITGTKDGGGPQVRIFNSSGKLINPGFFAYAKEYRGGVNVAVGDVNGDGNFEIATGAGVGGGPHVRIFSVNGKLVNPGFFAYDKKFRGGVNVAVGDLDNDGKAEIITGPGKGGAPHVKIFDIKGELKLGQFFAFDKNNTDGVAVAVADIDGNDKLEIIATTNNAFSFVR